MKLVNIKDGRIAEVIEEGKTSTKVNIAGVTKELKNATIKRFWKELDEDATPAPEPTVEATSEPVPEEVIESDPEPVKEEKKPETKKPERARKTTNSKKAPEPDEFVEPKPEEPKVEQPKPEKAKAEPKPKKAPAEIQTSQVTVNDDLDKIVDDLNKFTIANGGGSRATNSYFGLTANNKVIVEVHKLVKANKVTCYFLKNTTKELPAAFAEQYADSIKNCKFSFAINVSETGADAVNPLIVDAIKIVTGK